MYDKNDVTDLIKLLNDNELTEISVKDGEKEIVIKKEKAVVPASSTISAVEVKAPETAPVAPTVSEVDTRKKITSPMVGTFYASSSPTAAPYVEVGDVVSEGQVICIIEAMKLMNEIEADKSGKIVEICVQNGQNVEFGQTLMYIE